MKTKSTIVFLIFLSSFFSLFSYTTISGQLSGTLTSGTYFVSGDVWVAANTTLTIEPNTVLKFDTDTELTVLGTLNAVTTDGNFIIFTSKDHDSIGETIAGSDGVAEKGDWLGIEFVGTGNIGGIANMTYCNILYGGGNSGANITFNDSQSANLNYVVISLSENYGVEIINCSPNISHSWVAYTDNHGIYIHSSDTVINDCVIGYGATGIYFADTSSSPTITNNHIHHNNEYPIFLFAQQVDNINGNTLADNTYNFIKVVGGTISKDATWYKPDTYYDITGSIQIMGQDGADNVTTLTIEAGTVLKMDNNSGIYIGDGSNPSLPGGLIAIGTETENIQFTSSQSTPVFDDWDGIIFSSNAQDAQCRLEYCDISYGSDLFSSNVTITNSSPTIINSTIQYGAVGVSIQDGNPAITNCTINNNNVGIGCYGISSPTINTGSIYANNQYGIYLDSSSAPVITNLNIYYNGISGIFVNSASAEPVISNCSIFNNYNYPIELYCTQVANVQNNIYTNNTHQKIKVLGGTISQDATWSNASIPYLIDSDISVLGTDGADSVTTLTLEAGCALEFYSETGLTIGSNTDYLLPGALVANGTEIGQITFTSASSNPAAGDWDGIYFSNYSDDSICSLNYCTISYGGFQSNENIYCYNSSPQISNTTTQYGDGNGVTLEYSNATFTNVTFQFNTHGIHAANNSSPTITNCTFSNNSWNGIMINNDCSAIITDCNVTNNAQAGLYYNGANTGFLAVNNTFSQNGTHPIITHAPIVPYFYGNSYTNNGINSILVDGGTVSLDGTWQNQGIPYYISNTVYVQGMDGVDNVTTLEIAAGTQLNFFNSGLSIGHDTNSNYTGALRAIGTSSEPIRFTSNNSSPVAGDWDRIYFANYSDDTQNIMSNCIIEYGGSSALEVTFEQSGGIIMESVIRFSGNSGIYCHESNANLSYLELYDNSNAGIEVHGSSVTPTIDHITLSNNAYGFLISSTNNPTISNSVAWYNTISTMFLQNGVNVDVNYSNFEHAVAGTGNINSEPAFKNSWAYDYDIMFYSPYINKGDPNFALDPDGTRTDMGANPFDSTPGIPTITSVADVPNDQGLQVHVIWDGCDFDQSFSQVPITQYSLWRNDNLSRTDNLPLIRDFSQLTERDKMKHKEPIYYDNGREILTFITLVPAMGFDEYAVVSPTLQDSSSTGNHAAAFTVFAHTDMTAIHFASSSESGYSVDNIAPIATKVVATRQINMLKLSWDKVEYGEFEGNLYPEKNGVWYKIYAGNTPDFDCDSAHFVTITTNLEYLYNLSTENRKFFKVLVSDKPN